MTAKKVLVKDVVSTVKTSGITKENALSQVKKRERMNTVLNRDLPNLSSEEIDLLERLGFVWFVNDHFVEKFEHTAALIRPNTNESYAVTTIRAGNTVGVFYDGDIPYSILDKIQLLKSHDFDCFTIHSHKELPVSFVMPEIDPVVVGWKVNPKIKKHQLGDNESIWKSDQFSIGVVVGLWQGENEVDIV